MPCGAVRCCAVLCRGEFMSYQRSHLGLAWRIVINAAPLSRAHRSASSAAQRCAVPRGAVPCRALPVPCRAVRYCRAALCHAVPCCVRFAVLFLHAQYHSKCHTTGTTAVRTRYYMLNHKKCSRSLAQPSYSSAAPRSAVPCPAVLCRAARCFLPNIQQYQAPCDTRYRPVCLWVCTRLFFSLSAFDRPLSVLLPRPRKLHTYWRSEREIANKHTAQHRAIRSAYTAALGIIKLLDAPNHGSLLSAAFTFSCSLPCASVAGGVSRPRSGALVYITLFEGSRV